MKAEQFRPLNWVQYWYEKDGKTEKYIQIDGVSIGNGVNSGLIEIRSKWLQINDLSFKPILFDKDWLDRFEFIQVDPVNFISKYALINKDISLSITDSGYFSVWIGKGIVAQKYIKYVHEFQNWIHANTDHELFYNPKR